MDNDLLTHYRTSKIEHVVKSSNKDNTVTLTVLYKGQVPLRARLVDKNKKLETSILLDYIQLVIVDKKLTNQELIT